MHDVIVKILLPLSGNLATPKPKTGELLVVYHCSPSVSLRRSSVNNQMLMLRHETINQDDTMMLRHGRLQTFNERGHDFRIGEERRSIFHTCRKRDGDDAFVAFRGRRWCFLELYGEKGSCVSSGIKGRRLKPAATISCTYTNSSRLNSNHANPFNRVGSLPRYVNAGLLCRRRLPGDGQAIGEIDGRR